MNKYGIALKNEHIEEILQTKPKVDFFEIHTENFVNLNRYESSKLLEIRKDYPISSHCVGLSLGSIDGVPEKQLLDVKNFIEKLDPFLISDHLSWNRHADINIPDLLPVFYSEEYLNLLANNIDKAQNYLNKTILIENPSSYIIPESDYHEADFLIKLAKKSGCNILLDINNIYVSCKNNSWNIDEYLKKLDLSLVKQIHLAGHRKENIDGEEILIDDHGSKVIDEVWNIYKNLNIKNSNILIEWDSNIPTLKTLLEESEKSKIN